MLAYVGLCCGQCGPILLLCWPMLASCWSMLSQKIRKMGTAKKNTVKRRIFWWSAAYLGANVGPSWSYVGPSWGYVGPSWGYVGPSWGYVGPSWSYVGPSWGYVGPSWGLGCPRLGAMLLHLGAMFAHREAYVGPCWPIWSHRFRQRGRNAKTTKHRKTR